jgi:hypothetical protein
MLKKWFKKIWCCLGFSHCTVTSFSLETYKDPCDPLQYQRFARCKWCGVKGMVDSQGNLF